MSAKQKSRGQLETVGQTPENKKEDYARVLCTVDKEDLISKFDKQKFPGTRKRANLGRKKTFKQEYKPRLRHFHFTVLDSDQSQTQLRLLRS